MYWDGRAPGAPGLVILAFPCTQFGAQEPKPISEIRRVVGETYGIPIVGDSETRNNGFTLFEKVEVNGAKIPPLWSYVKRQLPGSFGAGFVPWNFTKYLVDVRGQPRERFLPTVTPNAMRPSIDALLAEAAAGGVVGGGGMSAR